MNFRQIKMLNDLEAKVAELIEFTKYQDARIINLEQTVEKLENPPKRPRGRPRKVNG